MDRDSTGETPSVLCPRQAAGLPNNLIPYRPRGSPYSWTPGVRQTGKIEELGETVEAQLKI